MSLGDRMDAVEPFIVMSKGEVEEYLNLKFEEFKKEIYDSGEVGRKFVRLLWADNYYDGPLDGVMAWMGKLAWFDCFDEVGGERHYAIYELSKKDAKRELESYFNFRIFYGKHNDINMCDDDFKLYFRELNFLPRYMTKDDYDRPSPTSEVTVDPTTYKYRRNKVLGWFRW